MRIPYDHAARSHLLIDFLEKHNKENKFDLIDMCSGSGSFLIWSIKRGLFFKKNILIDNDINLLKSVKSNLRKYLKNVSNIKSNTNNMSLTINYKNKDESSVSIMKYDCDNYSIKDSQPYVISYSAAVDLMSKSSIDKSLKLIKDNNILFFSLCFDGSVKWTPSHPYDKYILSFFNNHQQSDKGFGIALGYKSIDYIKKKVNKLGLKIEITNSPWIVRNKLQDDIIFMKRYLLDIKKSLFHMDGIDKTMLRQWYADKHESIECKKVKLLVGHKDILIHKQ